MKGFVIGATGSGTGKTTITLAVLAYLAGKGFRVAPFKVGPDFIDPGHHTRIAGRTSFNLDSWMLPDAYNIRTFQEKAAGADVAVVEGVMGLFDGYDGLSEAGSTAQMAKLLNLPVILVVSARGKARSAAAIVKGFESFDPDITLAGVIFSKTGSLRHYEYLKAAVEQNCTTPCLGFMPRDDRVVMPERHLGLVTADEMVMGEDRLALLSGMVGDHLDMEGLLERLDPLPIPEKGFFETPETPIETGPVIAVARDRAFCFYYPDNLEILEKYGARIVEFSPLEEDDLPDGIDGIYLGGGYPEVYAQELSGKKRLLAQIRKKSLQGMPIYGECGGFMALCQSLSSVDGKERFSMSGCFGFRVTMSGRLRSLGYREVTLMQDTIIGNKGDRIRGHEFHYSSLEGPDSDISGKDIPGQEASGGQCTDLGEISPAVASIYQVTSRAGQDISLKGYQTGNTLGSYLHVHFGSNEGCARKFVDACRQFRERKK